MVGRRREAEERYTEADDVYFSSDRPFVEIMPQSIGESPVGAMMRLPTSMGRKLIFLPLFLFAAFFFVVYADLNQSVFLVLFFSIIVSPLVSLAVLIILWKREPKPLRRTWLAVLIVETILVVLFVVFAIQFVIAMNAAMAGLRFQIIFGPFIWIYHELGGK